MKFNRKVVERRARIGVVGLGYVGLPLAVEFSRAGFSVTGIDLDAAKVDAVKRYLSAKYELADERITARGDCLLHPVTAEELLGSHDLVINATADYSVTALLYETAIALDCRFISVALQNDGDTVRVDVLPPPAGFEALPNSAAPPDGNTFEQFDAGCGNPVSSSSPSAVIEAAAVATRHAVALLVSRPIHPSGEVRHLSEVRRG